MAAVLNEDLPPGVPAADGGATLIFYKWSRNTPNLGIRNSTYSKIRYGTAVTIMSQGDYQQLFPGVPLTKSTLLRTYSGEPLSVLGVMNVEVQYKQQRESLKLTIVSGKGPSLLGRDWLQHLKLDWGEIKALASHTEGSLDYLIEKYNTLFTEGLGTIKTFQARLQVDPVGPPKFFLNLRLTLTPYEGLLRTARQA